jgi:drug/metabolite transporter (DMT)-like permease
MNKTTGSGVLGLVFGLGAVLSQDVLMKTLSIHYSVFQLLFVRSVFALLILCCLLPFISDSKVLRSNRKGLQVLRGSLQFLSFSCYYIALKSMPLLDLVTIFFTAPLIAVALSVPILKERVTAKHWAAISLGFVGALLMIGAQGLGFDHGVTLIALSAAVLYAGSVVATRVLGESDQSVTTALYTSIMYAVLAGLAVSALVYVIPSTMPNSASSTTDYWVTPTIRHLGLLAVAAVAVCIAFIVFAFAYRQAPVSILAPWEYSALIWGGVLGYLFWGELPSTVTIFGATLIVSTGIYISRLKTPELVYE